MTDILFKPCTVCKEERPYYLFNTGSGTLFPSCKICIKGGGTLRKSAINLSFTPLEMIELIPTWQEKRKFSPRRMIDNTRKRAVRHRKNNKLHKLKFTFGCSYKELIEYIKSQWTPEMNWNNYGEVWEIDHIESFYLIKDKSKFNYYSNLRPMLKEDHKTKSKLEVRHIREAKRQSRVK